jgi:hypothetical protein
MAAAWSTWRSFEAQAALNAGKIKVAENKLNDFISIFDITTILNGTPGSPAYPPMFAGPRAFGRTCPLP